MSRVIFAFVTEAGLECRLGSQVPQGSHSGTETPVVGQKIILDDPLFLVSFNVPHKQPRSEVKSLDSELDCLGPSPGFTPCLPPHSHKMAALPPALPSTFQAGSRRENQEGML